MTDTEDTMTEAEQKVKAVWADACAVRFMGGWMIRLYRTIPQSLSGFHDHESAAWLDAAAPLEREELK